MNPSLFWSTFWLNFSKPIVPSEHDVFFSVGPIGGEILKRSNEMPFVLALRTKAVFYNVGVSPYPWCFEEKNTTDS